MVKLRNKEMVESVLKSKLELERVMVVEISNNGCVVENKWVLG